LGHIVDVAGVVVEDGVVGEDVGEALIRNGEIKVA
jgi:hypothetical protein